MAENKEASHRTEEDVMEEKKEKGQEEAPKEREMHEEAPEEREGQEEFPEEKENGQGEEAAEDFSEEDGINKLHIRELLYSFRFRDITKESMILMLEPYYYEHLKKADAEF